VNTTVDQQIKTISLGSRSRILYTGDVKSYDVKKQYSSIIIRSDIKWSSFSPLAYFTVYTGGEIVDNDLYHVHSKHWMIRGDTFMYGINLRILKRKIKIDIKHVLRHSHAKYSTTSSVIKELIDVVGADMMKDPINHFVGMLNKTHRDEFETSLVSNKKEAKYLQYSEPNLYSLRKYKEHMPYYVCTYMKRSKLYLNYRFIYMRVIDEARTQMILKACEIGNSVVGCKTDALIVKAEKKVKAGKKAEVGLGEFYLEKGKFEYRYNPPITSKYNIRGKEPPKGTCDLVTGICAGTGKSYHLRNKVIPFIKDEDLYVSSYTNKARNIVNKKPEQKVKYTPRVGHTIAKLFGMPSRFDDIDYETFRGSTIVVDEVYCTPIEYIYIFWILHHYYEVHFIFAGDEHQKIMDMTKGSSTYGELVRIIDSLVLNRRHLTTNRRYDSEEYFELVKQLGRFNFKKYFKTKPFRVGKNIRHICVTNKKRREILEAYKDFKDLPDAPYSALSNTPKYARNELYTLEEIKKNNWKRSDFRLAYAMTDYIAQGDTFKDVEIVIHELEKMNTRGKYVAMSRVTDFKWLSLCL
jgi:hypothetical protein